jgi:hypothetical protein
MEHPTASAGTVVSERWQEVLDVFTPGLLGGRLVEVGLALSAAFQERERCLMRWCARSPSSSRISTQALRELLWLLRHRRLHSEVTSARDRTWFTERFAAIARDPAAYRLQSRPPRVGQAQAVQRRSVQLQVRIEQEPNPAAGSPSPPQPMPSTATRASALDMSEREATHHAARRGDVRPRAAPVDDGTTSRSRPG